MEYFYEILSALGTDSQPKIELNTETVEKSIYHLNGIKFKSAFPHIEEKMPVIMASPKFTKWVNDLRRDQIDLKEFTITDVDFFGPVHPSRLGFVKGYGLAFDKESGDAIPAIAFVRGGAVAVLIIVIIQETGKKFVLLCNQLRFPAGCSLTEACAGMIDDQTGNVTGVVFNEVKQETGFVITEESLINLGMIIPSGGGCDEIVHLHAWETVITEKEFEEKKTNIYGEGSYEKIKLAFYEFETFDDTLDRIMDVKAECCWRRYLKYCEKNS